MFSNVCFDEITKPKAVFWCLSFASFYVGSLYIKSQKLPRDHPQTIKERIQRVSIVSILACFIVYNLSSEPSSDCQSGKFLQWMGIRLDGILYAIILPVLLIFILFLGPITMFAIDHGIGGLFCCHLSDIILWRNYIVAPLSEELVFRGCMMPLLVPAFGQVTAILLAPWFFGLAHIHHAYEMYKTHNHPLITIVVSTLFQASYTTVFGILSSYIFVRTGHLISAFVSHSVCNMMGFPEFEQALQHKRKYFICTCFVVGLVLFLLLLQRLTEPVIYSNVLYGSFLSS